MTNVECQKPGHTVRIVRTSGVALVSLKLGVSFCIRHSQPHLPPRFPFDPLRHHPYYRRVVDQSRRFEFHPKKRNPMRIRSPLTAPDLSSSDANESPGDLNDTLRCGAHCQPPGCDFDRYGIEQGLARLDVRLDPSASVRLPVCSQPQRSSYRPAPRCPQNPNKQIVKDTHVRHINTRRSLEPPGWSGPQSPWRKELPQRWQQ